MRLFVNRKIEDSLFSKVKIDGNDRRVDHHGEQFTSKHEQMHKQILRRMTISRDTTVQDNKRSYNNYYSGPV